MDLLHFLKRTLDWTFQENHRFHHQSLSRRRYNYPNRNFQLFFYPQSLWLTSWFSFSLKKMSYKIT